jgi:hypothetical protein
MNSISRRNGSFTSRHLALCALLALAVGCQQAGDGGVAGSSSEALTQDHVVPTGQGCTNTGKHDAHAGYSCTTCHQCAGTLSFDAAIAGPTAAFDPVTKNCSSVACHGVAAGTFTYAQWDWGCECMVEVSVPYGGGSGAAQPNWYATGGGSSCGACHGYPPKYNGVAYAWHSGKHGIGISNGNTCQLCHPNARGAYVYGGAPSYVSTSGGLISSCAPGTYCEAPGQITQPSMHGNGVVDVTPGWANKCFGCH